MKKIIRIIITYNIICFFFLCFSFEKKYVTYQTFRVLFREGDPTLHIVTTHILHLLLYILFLWILHSIYNIYIYTYMIIYILFYILLYIIYNIIFFCKANIIIILSINKLYERVLCAETPLHTSSIRSAIKIIFLFIYIYILLYIYIYIYILRNLVLKSYFILMQ